jgi:hypothetical protein
MLTQLKTVAVQSRRDEMFIDSRLIVSPRSVGAKLRPQDLVTQGRI